MLTDESSNFENNVANSNEHSEHNSVLTAENRDRGWLDLFNLGELGFLICTKKFNLILITRKLSDLAMNTASVGNANLLISIVQNYRQNITKRPNSNGCCYTDELRLFATYLYLLSGPLAYQTLRANLTNCIPSTNSVQSYIHKHVKNSHLEEGVLRCLELRNYLEMNNLQFIVSLSEDATRHINRVQYDSATNQLIGFCLPINNCGMPTSGVFLARSASEIEQHFLLNSDNISSFVNVVMAQPLAVGYPPFCLLLFGSNNKYNTMDVVKRWTHIKHELNKVGIEVLAISSDSDPRYNAAMRCLSKLAVPTTIFADTQFFQCQMFNGTAFIQDTEHIGTKFRNALLKTNKNLDLKIGD